MRASSIVSLLLLASLGACRPLINEPWAMFPEDSTTGGVMVGWNFLESNLKIEAEEDSEGPLRDQESERRFDAKTVFDLGVKGDYFVTENWIAGARIEWRSNEPENFTVPFEDLSYRFAGEDYVTLHYVLGLRYLFDPMGASKRWRSFLGVELSYVSELETEFEVESSLGNRERVKFEGEGLYSVGATGGLTLLLSDETMLEFGALWEWPLGLHEAPVEFGDPVEPSSTRFELEPNVYVIYVALMGSI